VHFFRKKQFEGSDDPEVYLDYWQERLNALVPKAAFVGIKLLNLNDLPERLNEKLRYSISQGCIDSEVLDEWFKFIGTIPSGTKAVSPIFK
jgi:hypothetical protein